MATDTAGPTKLRTELIGRCLAACVLAASAATAGELDVKEPDKTEVLAPRKPERQKWSWNRPPADVTATGDLKWKPEPFKFEAGPSVRYVDFEKGSDDNAGTGKDAAWKHHPWDPNATGKAKECQGAHTYVFKRGVVYRGALRASESGEEQNPIRLTSDPAWGSGDAVICGSERVAGWKQGAEHKDIPEPEKVWYADVGFVPRCVWEVKANEIERVPLARTPNWKVSNPEDVMSEWWKFEQPEWWTGKWKVNGPRGRAHMGVDTKHLTKDPDYYKDAVVRTEYAIVMGTPYPTRVEAYDAGKKAIVFQGLWFGDSANIWAGNRYYLEDKPQYLDSPGEFWFDRKGEGGRLYLRLSGDRDPNQAVVEAARHFNLIEDKASAASPNRLDILKPGEADKLETSGISHVQITGLTFRLTNTCWDLTQPSWGHKEVDNACIRLLGSSDDVRISNCRFEHAGKAVRIAPLTRRCRIGKVVVSDNEIQFTDHGAVHIADASEAKVLRNRLFMIGLRPYRQDHGHALCADFPELMEIAGNVLDRCYGAGLFLFGGKGGGDARDRPLARNLVYGNRVTNSLLAANDWGGIETWQGGPFYVYNNVSGNANGYWNWAYNASKPASGRLGFAYYLDGAFKNYHFNNVAWGISNDPKSPLCSNCAFYEACPTIHNAFFNNTAYLFAMGSSWSPGGGRQLFLGNLWLDISTWVFMHGKLKEDKDPPPKGDYPHETMAYGRNVFSGVSKQFAVFESSGKAYADVASFQQALEGHKPLSAEGNVLAESSPVRNAAEHDFRPKANSEAVDRGVRYFVPWALSGMVGEWNFRRNHADPTVLFDDHWYMASYYTDRDVYWRMPTFNLKAANVTADDYVEGPLEDWTRSALKLNGKDQYASLSHADMTTPVTYEANVNNRKTKVSVTGKDLATPDLDAGNLLVEVCFRTEPNHAGSVIVAKMAADAGYQLAVNKAGGLTLTLKSGGQKAELACGAKINDGKWHHALAEADRARKSATIYVDGKRAAEGALALDEKASLSNAADLLVGKGPDGSFFAGAVDFLRLARGTLADAKTTIEELYDWEFDGPFLRDFAGREITGKGRDAGAFEYVGD